MKQNKISYVENLTNKVFKQAQEGKIKFENDTILPWVFHVKFYSRDMEANNDVPTVIIRDKNIFLTNVENYLSVARKFYENDKSYFELTDESFDEKLFMDLIVNATNYDLNNIEEYVVQRTKMLQAKTVYENVVVLGDCQGGTIYGKIMKAKSNLEGPYCFHCWITQNEERFILPYIYFGKENKTINLYAIQTLKVKQENKFAKKMDRFFRKANKGVDMEDEILSQVSPNALISLVVFMAYQKLHGVNEINAVNFMPIRYNANLTTGKLKLEESEDENEFLEKHDRNQFNITNRFMNTLIRYAHHFGYEFEYDEIKEKLVIDLTAKENELVENIVIDIDKDITKNIETNKDSQYVC